MRVYNNKEKGFTLIEMLVAIAIFSIIMIMVVGSLVILLNANRKARAISDAVNNLNAPLVLITRELADGTDYHVDNGGKSIDFLPNGAGTRTVYYYDDVAKAIKQSTDGGSTYTTLTDAAVSIDDLTFTQVNYSGGIEQPKVLITMKATAGNGPAGQADFNVQTTISQRYMAP